LVLCVFVLRSQLFPGAACGRGRSSLESVLVAKGVTQRRLFSSFGIFVDDKKRGIACLYSSDEVLPNCDSSISVHMDGHGRESPGRWSLSYCCPIGWIEMSIVSRTNDEMRAGIIVTSNPFVSTGAFKGDEIAAGKIDQEAVVSIKRIGKSGKGVYSLTC
jgi:hypothetical protein